MAKSRRCTCGHAETMHQAYPTLRCRWCPCREFAEKVADPDPAGVLPAEPLETLLDATKTHMAPAMKKKTPKPDVTCCRCGAVLPFVQAWRGGTPERYWCGVCVRYAGAAQEYVPEEKRVRCVDSPNDQHGYECALCGHRLSGLAAAAFEAARVRAYRQARIWEPNMDLYNAAMSVYCAAFGKDEERDRSVAAGAGDPLHQRIMNLPMPMLADIHDTKQPSWKDGYRVGHRDARHAAAELVSALGRSPARPEEQVSSSSGPTHPAEKDKP